MKKLIGHIRSSLPTKISLSMFLAALLVFILANGILAISSRRYFHTVAMNNLSEALSTAVARAERYLRSVETVTNATAQMSEQYFTPDSLLAFSRRIVELNAFVSGCSISARADLFPERGRYFSAYTVRKGCEIVTVVEDDYEYFDYPWYSQAAESGRAGWVDPFVDDNAGSLSADHMIASYCRPLYDNQNRFLGVISTDLSLPEFSRVLSSIKPYPHSYLILLGSDGRYYVHPDSTKIVHRTIFDITDDHYNPDKLTLGYQMTGGRSGRMHVDVDKVHSLICYQPVPGTDWSAALVSPEKDVLHGYKRLENVIFAVAQIVLLLIFYICRRSVVHAFAPISLLVRQSRRIIEGDYSAAIPRERANSVVGQLQNSFADMQETLSEQIRSLDTAIGESERRGDEIQQANAALEEALHRRSIFVSNMTHQIRTPLNLILGFTQLIRDAGSDITPNERRRILHVIDYNTMTLNRMSLMLYDSSDRGYQDEMLGFVYEPVSCNAVARECIGDMSRYFPDVDVEFKTSLEDGVTLVSDHLYLMRSLRELLFNSAKYSDGDNISLTLSLHGDRVRFVVQDTGRGIPAEIQENIFTPFYKVDNLSEGLGVGLPLTKRHVMLLGGSLELDGHYSRGCRFVMEFPLENKGVNS